MTRLSYRLYRLASAVNYRVPRRFTKGGLLCLAGMILTGAVGTDMDQSIAFQAFALLFCLLGMAAIWAPFFRGRFSVQRALPRLASVGQVFHYRIDVRNLSPRPYRDLDLLEDLAEPYPTFEQFSQSLHPVPAGKTFRLVPRQGPGLDLRPAILKQALVSPLMPHGSASADVEVLPLRRGPLRFKGMTLARRDPLGLIRGFVKLRLPQSLLVLPKRYPVPVLSLDGTRNYQPGGVAMASSIGESEEFVSLREYRPGDPFRRLHWRSWARLGRPIVKEFQDEFFARHGLVLDTFAPAPASEAFEEAVSVAASFACTLDTQESLLDLLFVESRAFCFTAGRGLGQSEQVLEVLASVMPSKGGKFEVLRELVLRHAAALSGCICVFLSWDEDRKELVRQLKVLGLPVLTLLILGKEDEKKYRRDRRLTSDVRVLRLGSVAQDLMKLEGASK